MTGLASPAALDALRSAALAADAAEKTFRASLQQRLERLEADRRHAFRRFAFLKALTDADAIAPDREASHAAQRAAAAAELDWDEIDAARSPVLEALGPLADAVFEARIGEGSPEDGAGVLAALDAFEAWHLTERGKPFEELFDTYAPETPLVDF